MQPLPIGQKVEVTSGEFRGTKGITKTGTNNSTAAYVHVHDVDAKTGEWSPQLDKEKKAVVIGVPPAAIKEA